MKFLATPGYSRSTQVIIGVTPQGVVVDTGAPSTKVLASGQGVLEDGHGLQVSAITDPGAGATIPDPGPYNTSFSATTTKIKAGAMILRVDDETGVINATPQIPGTPPIPWPVAFKYKIASAGQSKVRGE